MATGFVGQTLPRFSLPRLSTGNLDTSTLVGKKTLYFWWGSW